MEHRRIADLSVSVVGVGCNQFGTVCDAALTGRIIDEALEAGINFFDTADEYGRDYSDPTDPSWGVSEEYLGQALKGRRDKVVLATKFGVRPPADPDRGGAGGAWIRRAVEDSLRRLSTDYIDLYQLHVPDPTVPIDETLTALDDLVRSGKVRAVGACNLSGDQLRDAASVAAERDVVPFASVQAPLNIVQRASLEHVMPACEELGLAFIPYYPLASGILTGKYRRDQPLPSGTRLTDQVGTDMRNRILNERTYTRVEVLDEYASSHGRTMVELAIGWLLGHERVASVIAGAAKPGQASANAASAGWAMTAAEIAEITDALVAATAPS